jgi:Matrixin
MMRATLFLPSVVLGLLVLASERNTTQRGELASPNDGRHSFTSGGSISAALATFISPRDDDQRLAEIRRKLRQRQAGTYIQDIIADRDSALARWPDRPGRPLTVWIQPFSAVADFNPAAVERVRDAFLSWDMLRLPVRFAFRGDSASAEVHVTWIDHFKEPISGRTRWTRNDGWAITDANIILAVHHNKGRALGDEETHAMALHEIGHLLGLDHTKDTLTIMAPRVHVRELTDEDRATVRLLYSLPPGKLR